MAADVVFDSERKYLVSFMVLDLRKPTEDRQWGEYLTREELTRKDQEGHQSLREEYEKK